MFNSTSFNATSWLDMLEMSAPTSGTVDISGNDFYDDMLAMVAEMLEEFDTGRVVLFRESTVATTSDDPFAPEDISRTPVPVNAVVTGYSSVRIDNAAILAGDRRVLIDPTGLTVAPFKGQRVSIDSQLHSIIEVKSVMAAGTVCLFIVQARTTNLG